jgi:hypothetical protein
MFFMAASALFILAGATSCGDKGNEYTASLKVDPMLADFKAMGNQPVTLNVTTDAASWSIGTQDSWYEAVQDGNKIVITAQNNSEATERNHTLVISAPGAKSVNVLVKQAALSSADVHSSLKGSQYIVIQLDAISREIVGEDKIIADYADDGVYAQSGYTDARGNCIMIWDNTMAAGEATEAGFYGNNEGYPSFACNPGAGWSGGGLMCGHQQPYSVIDLTPMNEGEWYFHAAFKATPGVKGIYFAVTAGNPGTSEWKYETDSATIPFPGALSMSDWLEVEIPVSDMLDAGFLLNKYEQVPDGTADSGRTIIQWGGPGDAYTFQYDAVFFYKK